MVPIFAKIQNSLKFKFPKPKILLYSVLYNAFIVRFMLSIHCLAPPRSRPTSARGAPRAAPRRRPARCRRPPAGAGPCRRRSPGRCTGVHFCAEGERAAAISKIGRFAVGVHLAGADQFCFSKLAYLKYYLVELYFCKYYVDILIYLSE